MRYSGSNDGAGNDPSIEALGKALKAILPNEENLEIKANQLGRRIKEIQDCFRNRETVISSPIAGLFSHLAEAAAAKADTDGNSADRNPHAEALQMAIRVLLGNREEGGRSTNKDTQARSIDTLQAAQPSRSQNLSIEEIQQHSQAFVSINIENVPHTQQSESVTKLAALVAVLQYKGIK